MEWLLQNWTWIVFAVGLFLLMRHGGLGHHGHGGHGHHSHGSRHSHGSEPYIKDPVSGEPVDPDKAVNTQYQGRIYYFSSRENREKFEASPVTYANSDFGQESDHPRRRHGC